MDMAGALAGYVPGREQLLTMAMNLDSPIRELLRTNCRSIDSLKPDAASRIRFNTAIEFRINKLGEPLQLEIEETDKALFFWTVSDGEKLRFTLKHNSAALPNQQAKSIAGSMMQAIQCFWQDPNQKVRDVDLVDQRSRRYIAQWNNRAMALDYHLSIAGSVDEISHLKPDAQAIASWDGELTYDQLENLSTRLALHLRGLGIGEGVMVPLCFGKSLWAIVATLAVLKSGAAFVPLDTSHPLARLKEIIAHVNAGFVLVSDQHAALFAGTADNVIVISESTVGHLQDVGILAHHAQPHHVAYVLFTSGSTGSPKGCVVEHRALAAVICHGEALGINTESRGLSLHHTALVFP
ncbi:unnamed protein product [Penicillium egyptiacum]|uniref:AMP-dependent synthetase/ligase domain-containing protein n=1 Tax=Penicillium egyptiacum TaxID=1303716 RepID=A0A9W4P165_9EURO|nr:unnamed protein product [Penicillium egyptiacum]